MSEELVLQRPQPEAVTERYITQQSKDNKKKTAFNAIISASHKISRLTVSLSHQQFFTLVSEASMRYIMLTKSPIDVS